MSLLFFGIDVPCFILSGGLKLDVHNSTEYVLEFVAQQIIVSLPLYSEADNLSSYFMTWRLIFKFRPQIFHAMLW